MQNLNDKKLLFWQNPATEHLLAQSLKNDQISITSTDTILGFLAQLSKKSFDQLNVLKELAYGRPYIILIASPAKLDAFVDAKNLDLEIKKLIDHCWPGPVTFVFKAKLGVPTHLVSEQGTIALRCPKHDGMLKLLKSFEGLFSSSANKTMDPAPATAEELDSDLVQKVAYIVVDKDQTKPCRQPSTLIDVSSGKEAKIVRAGAYPIQELKKVYAKF